MAKNRISTALGVSQNDQTRQARRHAESQASAREFAIEAARLASDLKCEDVVVFDVRDLSDVADYLVIGSGTSDRQMRSVSDDIDELAEQQYDFQRFGRERDAMTTWVVLDYVDVVVHLFEPATRAHYDLEMLWGDAPRVAWRR